MDRADPWGESDPFAISRSVFVDIHDMVWAVGTVKIDDLGHSQAQVKGRGDEGSGAESLSKRRRRNSLQHGAAWTAVELVQRSRSAY